MNVTGWMVHIVTRKRRTGTNADGTPSYGAAETLRARVEKNTRLLRLANGKEAMVSHRICLAVEARYDDVFWLPSINGEPADDTASMDAARTPALVAMSSDKAGRTSLTFVDLP